jgi:hypothetical protein
MKQTDTPASVAMQPRLGGTLPLGQPPAGAVGEQQGVVELHSAPYVAQVAAVVGWHTPLWQVRFPQQPLPMVQGEP